MPISASVLLGQLPAKLLITCSACFLAAFFALKLLVVWSLLARTVVSFGVGYLPSYLDGSQYDGSRAWPWLQAQHFWRGLIQSSLGGREVRIIAPPKLAAVPQAILAAHPHGIASFSHGLFFTDAAGFLRRFSNLAGASRRDLAASIVFRVPIYRELLLWSGCVDASKPTAQRLLREGQSLFVYPGGEKEQLLTVTGKQRAYVRTRKGFCRLAVEFGVPVVPCYCFGETDLYRTSNWLLKLRVWVADTFHVALVVAFGQDPLFGLPLPMPLGAPMSPPHGLTVVLGEPLNPLKRLSPTGQRDEFDRTVDELHSRYLADLEALFDANKVSAGYPDAVLEILPAEKSK